MRRTRLAGVVFAAAFGGLVAVPAAQAAVTSTQWVFVLSSIGHTPAGVGMDPAQVRAKLAECRKDGWQHYRETRARWKPAVRVSYSGCLLVGTGAKREIRDTITVWRPASGTEDSWMR